MHNLITCPRIAAKHN